MHVLLSAAIAGVVQARPLPPPPPFCCTAPSSTSDALHSDSAFCSSRAHARPRRLQSIIGGQPLLIMGVAEPIALMYGFMYEFADSQDFSDVFVPWCTWVTIWTAIILFGFSITGAPSSLRNCLHYLSLRAANLLVGALCAR